MSRQQHLKGVFSGPNRQLRSAARFISRIGRKGAVIALHDLHKRAWRRAAGSHATLAKTTKHWSVGRFAAGLIST